MNKGQVKAIGGVVVGVMLAGFLMNQFRDIGIIAQAKQGYR